MTADPHPVLDLVRGWSAAEQANDAGRLNEILADDFVGVGPLGFVLTREQWLERFRNGLANRVFAVEEPQVHDHGTAAVVVGVERQETTWRGSENTGRFRLTLTAVETGHGWRVASVHIGGLQSAPTSPPA